MTRQYLLTVVGVAAASTSVGALVIHALGWLPMYFVVDVVAAPALVLLLVLGVVAKRIHEPIFLNRLLSGLWLGLAATLCYDGIRLLLQATGRFNYDVFFSHPKYGMLITGYPENTRVALVVGWLYHFWNGITLGIMYTLVAGRSHWLYAVGWALFLELAWLTALPAALELRLGWDAIIVSLIGHTTYGVVLGVLSQRYIRA